MLKAVLYQSEALVHFDDSTLGELTVASSARNREFLITGYLFLNNMRFVQYFEGPPAHVDQLLGNICNDKRHEVRMTLVEESIAERRFPSWNMRLVTADGIMSMEDLLQQHLEFLGTLPPKHRQSASPWQMVDKLSQLQSRLSTTPGCV